MAAIIGALKQLGRPAAFTGIRRGEVFVRSAVSSSPDIEGDLAALEGKT